MAFKLTGIRLMRLEEHLKNSINTILKRYEKRHDLIIANIKVTKGRVKQVGLALNIKNVKNNKVRR